MKNACVSKRKVNQNNVIRLNLINLKTLIRHNNLNLIMFKSKFIVKSKCIWTSLINVRHDINFVRMYAKKVNEKDCRRALADIPPEGDTVCTHPCERRQEKRGVLHRIKLKIIEGGTNFGSTFSVNALKNIYCNVNLLKQVHVTLPTNTINDGGN